MLKQAEPRTDMSSYGWDGSERQVEEDLNADRSLMFLKREYR